MRPTPELLYLIHSAATFYSIRPVILRAIVEHESNYDPKAVGDGGAAHGLMQMHPEAASDVHVDWELLFDPTIAVYAGAKYLRHLLDTLGDERKAVMAYNGGAGTVRQGPSARFYHQAVAYATAVYKIAERIGDFKRPPGITIAGDTRAI